MNWNIFSPVKRTRRRGKSKDAFDEFINAIEVFAPREYLSEREMFYYNYRIMDSYKKALLALLDRLSRKENFSTDPDRHGRALFLDLKNFYDPKGRLSTKEALSDGNLIKRFRDLFRYFYGKKQPTREVLEAWLKPLGES